MARKDAYWFRHDSNSHRDPKLLRIRAKWGAEGYGLFWLLAEIMREQPEGRIRREDIPVWAVELRAERLAEFIEDCCSCGLYQCDQEAIWSDRMLREISSYDAAIEQRVSAGKAGATKRWNSEAIAAAKQPLSESIAAATPPHGEAMAAAERDDSEMMAQRLTEINRQRRIGTATRAADGPPPEPEPVDNSALQLLSESPGAVSQRRNGRHARASPFEHEVMAFFEAYQPITNYPAAWKAVHSLVGKARALARDGPEEALKAIIGAFLALTRGEFPAPLAASDLRWWRGKAFSPQMLCAVFDQVAALMQSVQADENPEGLEAARRAFAKWRPG